MELLPTKRKASGDDNMIPMINVVFLLLIFFMIAGQIKPAGNKAIELPVASSGAQAEQQPDRLEIDASNQLTFNGQHISLEALQGTLRARLQARLQNRPEAETTTNHSLALIADKHLSATDLDAVLQLFREQGQATVTLFTQSGDVTTEQGAPL